MGQKSDSYRSYAVGATVPASRVVRNSWKKRSSRLVERINRAAVVELVSGDIIRLHISTVTREVVMAGMPKQKIELFSETLRLAFTKQGEGRAFLILHGGAGSASVS